MEIRPVSGGSGEEDTGHEIDPNEVVLGALREQEQERGNQVVTNPVPAKPAVAAEPKQGVAWFLAERDVKKSCQALDAEDIELLKAAAGDDPMKFVELADKQQAKREALVASRPKEETEREKLEREATREILGGGGPGGSGAVKPQEPTPAEKVKAAVEKGDTRGLQRATAEVINTGKDGKPIFESGVRITSE